MCVGKKHRREPFHNVRPGGRHCLLGLSFTDSGLLLSARDEAVGDAIRHSVAHEDPLHR
jgi:hypothetical protein